MAVYLLFYPYSCGWLPSVLLASCSAAYLSYKPYKGGCLTTTARLLAPCYDGAYLCGCLPSILSIFLWLLPSILCIPTGTVCGCLPSILFILLWLLPTFCAYLCGWLPTVLLACCSAACLSLCPFTVWLLPTDLSVHFNSCLALFHWHRLGWPGQQYLKLWIIDLLLS